MKICRFISPPILELRQLGNSVLSIEILVTLMNNCKVIFPVHPEPLDFNYFYGTELIKYQNIERDEKQ